MHAQPAAGTASRTDRPPWRPGDERAGTSPRQRRPRKPQSKGFVSFGSIIAPTLARTARSGRPRGQAALGGGCVQRASQPLRRAPDIARRAASRAGWKSRSPAAGLADGAGDHRQADRSPAPLLSAYDVPRLLFLRSAIRPHRERAACCACSEAPERGFPSSSGKLSCPSRRPIASLPCRASVIAGLTTG